MTDKNPLNSAYDEYEEYIASYHDDVADEEYQYWIWDYDAGASGNFTPEYLDDSRYMAGYELGLEKFNSDGWRSDRDL